MHLACPILLPDDSVTEVALYVEQSLLENERVIIESPNRISFSFAQSEHVYLLSKLNGGFTQPPINAPFKLLPDERYELEARVTASGAEAVLWLIEYDSEKRLADTKATLTDGYLKVAWRTHVEHHSLCIALRLCGQGTIGLSELSLSQVKHNQLLTGVLAEFKAFSTFDDPAGYLPYTDVHHNYYDSIEVSRYQQIAGLFSGCRSVLDIGCGPGLLSEALLSSGVKSVTGLERDDYYLRNCMNRGLNAIKHDLNYPFPFLPSDHFDGVAINQCFDYLAPIAQRSVLRESHRVLKQSGGLYVSSRTDGQDSGDITRTSALSFEYLTDVLHEAGFGPIDVLGKSETNISVFAKPLKQSAASQQSLRIGSALELKPWGNTKIILPIAEEYWDNSSNRDFTLLTDQRKNSFRVAGKLVAYYTGYRKLAPGVGRAVCRATSADGQNWQRDPLPVLTPTAGSWDQGGVAAGSVVFIETESIWKYRMYYSAKDASGRWPGIGLALSDDGIRWQKQSRKLLTIADFPGNRLNVLALADVIQKSDGEWLMHVEGCGNGWAVYRAISADGLVWQSDSPSPTLTGPEISWAGAHVANPKIVEIEPGLFLMGFNAAGVDCKFKLGIAQSYDGIHWRNLYHGPMIEPDEQYFKMESLFFSRDSILSASQKVYYFGARDNSTEVSSTTISAMSNENGSWPAGVKQLPVFTLSGDAQLSFQIRRDQLATVGELNIRIADRAKEDSAVITIDSRFSVVLLGQVVVSAAEEPSAIALCLRIILLSLFGQAEVELVVWQDGKLAGISRHTVLFAPYSVSIEPGAAVSIIDNLVFMQPSLPQLALSTDGDGSIENLDLHNGFARAAKLIPSRKLFCSARSEHPHLTLIRQWSIEQALNEPEKIAALCYPPGRAYPILRIDIRYSDAAMLVIALEQLWRLGLCYGVYDGDFRDQVLPAELSGWLERRGALMVLDSFCPRRILQRSPFTLALARSPGYSTEDLLYYAKRNQNLYLLSTAIADPHALDCALSQVPTKLLFASGENSEHRVTQLNQIEHLELPFTFKGLLLSENLRFLTNRMQWQRVRAIGSDRVLMFPSRHGSEMTARFDALKKCRIKGTVPSVPIF